MIWGVNLKTGVPKMDAFLGGEIHPTKMDDLGVPMGTPISGNIYPSYPSSKHGDGSQLQQV